jgi:hypothetical protein
MKHRRHFFHEERTTMNSPIPNSAPEHKRSFAHCGRYGVYLVSGLPCPYCSRELHATDIGIDRRGDTWITCAGCHKDILKIEESL